MDVDFRLVVAVRLQGGQVDARLLGNIVDGKLRRFLRDLDSGEIASTCLAVDPDVKLVVIDGAPQVDAKRAEGLSREIDELLSHGSEVIVTCVPSCDLYGSYQPDRLRIAAAEPDRRRALPRGCGGCAPR